MKKILFSKLVHQQIMHYVHKSSVEVSGLGMIVPREDGALVVTKVILLPQVNGATSTDIEPEHVAKAMYLLRDEPGHMNFWWHSHVNMGVFWSGTDMDTIRKVGAGGWLVSTVFNKKGEMKSSLYMEAPFKEEWMTRKCFWDDLETEVIEPALDQAVLAEWDAAYEENVTKHNRAALTPYETGLFSSHGYRPEEVAGLSKWERGKIKSKIKREMKRRNKQTSTTTTTTTQTSGRVGGVTEAEWRSKFDRQHYSQEDLDFIEMQYGEQIAIKAAMGEDINDLLDQTSDDGPADVSSDEDTRFNEYLGDHLDPDQRYPAWFKRNRREAEKSGPTVPEDYKGGVF